MTQIVFQYFYSSYATVRQVNKKAVCHQKCNKIVTET